MTRSLQRFVIASGALIALAPKLTLAYRGRFWFSLVSHALVLIVQLSLWSAVFAGRGEVGGISASSALRYLLLVQLFIDIGPHVLLQFGQLLREGSIQGQLLRPMDLQVRFFLETVPGAVMIILQRLPLTVLAWVLLELPLNPGGSVLAAFAVSGVLALGILFCMQWLLSAVCFFTTNSWGLLLMLSVLTAFMGGGLLPVELMPGWYQVLFQVLPFGQGLYVPSAILAGLAPSADVWGACLTQLLWLVGLVVASRSAFGLALKRVTVHGG